MTTHRALGRGLNALIPETATTLLASTDGHEAQQMTRLPLEKIRANPYQPRTTFDQEKLQELIRLWEKEAAAHAALPLQEPTPQILSVSGFEDAFGPAASAHGTTPEP